MAQKDFVVVSKLGEGTFGEVYKVKRLVDNKQYAMKKVKFTDLKDKDKKNTLNQIRILASINHPNIVQYKQAFLDEKDNHLCIVMELAPGGDLSQIIRNKFTSGEGFFQYEIWKYGYNILAGLKHLHDLNIIHRDLKPANLFFGRNGILKIGDLNVARRLTTDFTKTQTGTPNYASPQIWNTQPYSYQCDIWSFGCILYEMCTFRSPFRSKNMDQLYQKVQSCVYDKLPKRYSSILQDVISRCLVKKSKRISIQQLIKIFEKYTPSNNQKQKDIIPDSLLQTITFQNHKPDFSLLLPQSKYQTNIQNPEKSYRIQKTEKSKLFENYTKESSLKNIERIQAKVKNYEQAKISKSEKILPLNQNFSYLQKKSSIERNASFRQILNSISQIEEKLLMKRKPLERMNIYRRNLRVNLKL